MTFDYRLADRLDTMTGLMERMAYAFDRVACASERAAEALEKLASALPEESDEEALTPEHFGGYGLH